MGNIASVHLETGHIGEFLHNDRTKDTSNSIFDKSQNEYNLSAYKAIELYKKLLQERTEKYIKRTGQKLQKKTQTLLSVIVNIKENTTLHDLQKLAEKFEKEFGATPIQIAIHRDEGYVDEITGEKHINHHAHIMLMGLDSEGYSVKRKIKTRHLREMQDWAAEILGMERGKSARITKRKRLDTYEYKEAAKLKQKEVTQLKKQLTKKEVEVKELKITKKELEKEISNLRKQMINKNKDLEEKVFTKEDYRALSELKKQLNAKNTGEIYNKFLELKNKLETKLVEVEETKIQTTNKVKDKVLQDFATKASEYVETNVFRKDFIKVDRLNEILEEIENKPIANSIELEKKYTNALKYKDKTIAELVEKNNKLTLENQHLRRIISQASPENIEKPQEKTIKIELIPSTTQPQPQKENKKLKEENKKLKEKLQQESEKFKRENEKMRKEKEELIKQLQMLAKNLETIENKFQEAQQKLSKYQEIIEYLTKEKEYLEEELKDTKQKLKKQKTKKSGLKL